MFDFCLCYTHSNKVLRSPSLHFYWFSMLIEKRKKNISKYFSTISTPSQCACAFVVAILYKMFTFLSLSTLLFYAMSRMYVLKHGKFPQLNRRELKDDRGVSWEIAKHTTPYEERNFLSIWYLSIRDNGEINEHKEMMMKWLV